MTATQWGPSTLPLEEFSRQVPPGWKPGILKYPFKRYTQQLKLWWRTKSVDDDTVAALLAISRLAGGPRKKAHRFKITRDGQNFVGDDAIALSAAVDAVTGVRTEDTGF